MTHLPATCHDPWQETTDTLANFVLFCIQQTFDFHKFTFIINYMLFVVVRLMSRADTLRCFETELTSDSLFSTCGYSSWGPMFARGNAHLCEIFRLPKLAVCPGKLPVFIPPGLSHLKYLWDTLINSWDVDWVFTLTLTQSVYSCCCETVKRYFSALLLFSFEWQI